MVQIAAPSRSRKMLGPHQTTRISVDLSGLRECERFNRITPSTGYKDLNFLGHNLIFLSATPRHVEVSRFTVCLLATLI